jgi:hypothetical protein
MWKSNSLKACVHNDTSVFVLITKVLAVRLIVKFAVKEELKNKLVFLMTHQYFIIFIFKKDQCEFVVIIILSQAYKMCGLQAQSYELPLILHVFKKEYFCVAKISF